MKPLYSNGVLKSAVILFLFMVFAPGIHVYSQTRATGFVKGIVKDVSTKQPIDKVNVTLEGTGKGSATDSSGNFLIQNIPIGRYNLQFSHVAYSSKTRSNVVVKPNKAAIVEIELMERVIQGEEIVIEPTYFEKPKYSSVSTRKVSLEEIKIDPGGMDDVQRIFQSLPSVVSGSDRDNEIIVRAGMPGENMFMLDNIDIPNPNHFGAKGASGININMVNPLFVRDVSFYAGTYPSKYGGKVSSVLDIKLRDGNREETTGHFNLGLTGIGGIIEGPLANGKISYMFSGRKGYYDILVGSTRLKAVPEFHDFQGKLTYFISNNNKLTINGIYGKDGITSEDEETYYTRGADNIRTEGGQYVAGATLRTLWGDKGFSDLTISRVSQSWDHSAYNDNEYFYYFDRTEEVENTVKFDFEYKLNRAFDFSMGVHYKNIEFEQDKWAAADTMFSYNYPSNPTQRLGIEETYDELKSNKNLNTKKLSYYGQFNLNIIDSLDFHFGLRRNYFAYNEISNTSVRVGLSAHITYRTHINWGMGIHYQPPELVDLVLHPENTGLDYKTNRTNVIGVEHNFRPDIKGTVEFFVKDYGNVTIPETWITPETWDKDDGKRVSEGEGYVHGIEFNLEKKLSRKWHFVFSYSFSKARAHDRRYDLYYNWDYDFRHSFTFIGGFKSKLMHKKWYQNLADKFWFRALSLFHPFGDEVVTSLRLRYLGARPYTLPTYYPDLREWAVAELQMLNQNKVPFYMRLDLRVDKRYFFDRWNLLSYINIINVFNQNNVWDYSYRKNGSQDEVLQFQIMPVIGFSLEF